jgi:hypothetical protein
VTQAETDAIAAAKRKEAAVKRYITVANKVGRRNRKITLGNWCVYKFDEFNWVCAPVESFNKAEANDNRYYGRATDAMTFMLHKAVGDKVVETGDLKQILAEVKRAEAEICKCVRESELN